MNEYLYHQSYHTAQSIIALSQLKYNIASTTLNIRPPIRIYMGTMYFYNILPRRGGRIQRSTMIISRDPRSAEKIISPRRT